MILNKYEQWKVMEISWSNHLKKSGSFKILLQYSPEQINFIRETIMRYKMINKGDNIPENYVNLLINHGIKARTLKPDWVI